MKYKVDNFTNFCHVYRLPTSNERSHDFCVGGGHKTNFQMLDWFLPVPDIGQPAVTKEEYIKHCELEVKEIDHEEHAKNLADFLKNKNYVEDGKDYICITEYGEAFIFNSDGLKSE